MGARDVKTGKFVSPSDPPIVRFLSKIVRGDGCWEWTGTKTAEGYGQFCVRKGTKAVAHRMSYEHFVGPIPEGLYILHSCDNRGCVNPAHLRPGTQKENIADMDARGRRGYKRKEDYLRGEEHHNSTATLPQVVMAKRMHAAGERQCDIVRATGLSKSTVSAIRHGVTWVHVEVPDD